MAIAPSRRSETIANRSARSGFNADTLGTGQGERCRSFTDAPTPVFDGIDRGAACIVSAGGSVVAINADTDNPQEGCPSGLRRWS